MDKTIPVTLAIDNEKTAVIMEALSSCCQGAQQSEVFLPVFMEVRRQLTEQVQAVALERQAAAARAKEPKDDAGDAKVQELRE